MASLAHHNSGVLIPRDEYEELTEALATVFRIGARFTPALIERLDLIDGDTDEEPGGDDEPLRANGDTLDAAWVEWDGLTPVQRRGGILHASQNEDDELYGDETDGNGAEDEPCAWFDVMGNGPGCAVADNGIADGGGMQDAHGVDNYGLTYGIDQTKLPFPGCGPDKGV